MVHSLDMLCSSQIFVSKLLKLQEMRKLERSATCIEDSRILLSLRFTLWKMKDFPQVFQAYLIAWQDLLSIKIVHVDVMLICKLDINLAVKICER
jgi:hypothetical protein